MAQVFRWLVRLFSALVVLAGVALIGVYVFASRSLPEYTANFQFDDVSAEVEIVRDTANVPHIFGANDPDVFFGLGFAHAQDRLWQMVVLRRTAQGKLSEVFGERTVGVDELMRRLDLYRLAQSSVAVQDPYSIAALEAYAKGVNAWINTVNAEAMGRGAPEFWLFPPQIAPWLPAASLAVIKLMAVQLTGQLDHEVLRARTSLALDNPDRLADILPDAPGQGVMSLAGYGDLFPTANRYAALDADPLPYDLLSPVKPAPLAGASNAWAAGPSRSATGGTLLANDPHLGFSAPSTWYLARLELATGGVIGGTIPGMPLVLTGRSDVLGWGLTTAHIDDQDLYIEQLNPDNPNEYRTSDGFKPFEERGSVIQIKDGTPQTITLRWTDRGPVIPGGYYNIEAITPPGHVAALAWTALSGSDTSMSAALRVMQAQSVEDAIAAAEGYIAPAQNLTLADRTSIAMKTIGAIPRRTDRHQSQGRIPSPGWRPENAWQGSLRYTANPGLIAPDTDLLGNTNNKTVDRPFPFHVSFDWGDTQRVLRWERLMSSRRVHTRESFIEAQQDTVSASARTLLPLVAKDLWFNDEAAESGTPERRRQEALRLLADWNGDMNEHLPEPLIYSAWMFALQDRLIRDELGPLADSFTHVEPLFLERVFRDVDGAGVWCDVAQSSREETCLEAARRSLDDALIELGETYGSSPAAWRWGDAHQATHDHPVLGSIAGLGAVVNIRQSTSGGDNTLNRGRLRGGSENRYENVHGAGYRGVYDFADPDSSVFIIATGQSGHPLSRHYDDLGELWRRGEYIPMTLDPALARANPTGITTIRPAN